MFQTKQIRQRLAGISCYDCIIVIVSGHCITWDSVSDQPGPRFALVSCASKGRLLQRSQLSGHNSLAFDRELKARGPTDHVGSSQGLQKQAQLLRLVGQIGPLKPSTVPCPQNTQSFLLYMNLLKAPYNKAELNRSS